VKSDDAERWTELALIALGLYIAYVVVVPAVQGGESVLSEAYQGLQNFEQNVFGSNDPFNPPPGS